MCFLRLLTASDPFGDILWLMVSTFDHMWVPLVPLFLIFEPNVT